jgi:hypothetical protein
MVPADVEQQRRAGGRRRRQRSVAAVLNQRLRDCHLSGTELQILCAMTGLPVLSCGPNNPPLMGRYLCSAVQVYAEQNPSIFAVDAGRAESNGDRLVGRR